MWLLFAIIGYLMLAVVFILDKHILTATVSKPVVYTFYSTIVFFAALLAIPFGVVSLHGVDWVWAMLSGVAFGVGLATMFQAVEKSEASHINPFVGIVITVVVFMLSSLILNESFTNLQLTAIGVLIIACAFLMYEKTESSFGLHIGYAWGIFSGIFFAISHISAKYLYGLYPFFTGFIWTKVFVGFVGLACLFAPAVRASFKKQKKIKQEKKKHPLLLIGLDKIVGVGGTVLIQYAIATGSVTIVNALTGLQYGVMFVLIYGLSRWRPQVFHEYFTKKEIIAQSIGVLLLIVGSALLVW